MATTERSLGWATGVAATDGATTYASDRMSAFERAGLGTGVLLTGSYLAMSGAATTTLTIADGAGIVGGYFYESNGSVTISTSTLGSATYSIVIIANTAAGNQTVTANGAGTTTVVPATTRIALVTAGQLTTITTSITATNIVTLGTVTTSAGTITAITSYYPFASTRQQKTTQICYGGSGSVSMPLASTYYTITSYVTVANSSDNTMTFNATTGEILLYMSGMYLFDFYIDYDSSVSGTRSAYISNLNTNFATLAVGVNSGVCTYRSTAAQYITLTSVGTPYSLYLKAWASVVSRSVSNALIIVTRL
jgi:hypothetical protein